MLQKIMIVLVTLFPMLLPDVAANEGARIQSTSKEHNLKVSLTTGGGPFGPVKSRYRRQESILIVVWMTNNSENSVKVCDSHTLFQDRPILMKNGREIRYRKELIDFIDKHSDGQCEIARVPITVELPPHIPTQVGWFLLTEGPRKTGNTVWYDALEPGQYQLSIERSLACCDGKRLQSEEISFDVTP